jgi:HSP20 family protein
MVFRCTNPVHNNRIDQEMNRLFSTFFGEPRQASTASRPAAVNVWETDEAWLLESELPGVAPEHLDVSVLNDEVTISVQRPEVQEEDATQFRRERPRGDFSRTIQLPTAIDADGVEADLKHGVLMLTLPKSAAARRRKIQVNAGE